jgi:hypothetical protein
MELSTFSLKRDNLLIQIPKIWRWKYILKEESKIRFKAKSRNGYFHYLVKRLAEGEDIVVFINENKLELIDCDISNEKIQNIRLGKAEIFKYKRKSKIGYILTLLEKKNKIIILFELNEKFLETNKELVINIFNGVRSIE